MPKPIDDIHLQIMWDRLIAVVEEQAQTLQSRVSVLHPTTNPSPSRGGESVEHASWLALY